MNRRKFIKTGLLYIPTLFVCNEGIARLGNLEPEVGKWMDGIKSVSANYTSKSIVCNDWMMKELKANNLRSSIIRMGTLTGIGKNALKVPLIRDVNFNDDPNGIDEADFSEGTGLVTGGISDEWIITGCKQSDLYGLDTTNHSISYGVYICASNNQNGFAAGTFDSADFTYLYVSNSLGHSYFCMSTTVTQIDVADSAGSGFYCGSHNSSTDAKLFKRGSQLGSHSSPGTARNHGFWVGFGDVNNQNTLGVAVSTKTWGGYQFGRGISDANQSVLNYIWQRGMTILGRQAT